MTWTTQVPPQHPQPKSSRTHPGPEQLASRKNRLIRGVAALRVALDFPLVGKQRAIVDEIVREQERAIATLKSPARATSSKQAGPKAYKQPPSPEEQAHRACAGELRRQQRADLDKRLRMVEAKRQAERQETHRKSGYTDLLRRAPGSFEGGKSWARRYVQGHVADRTERSDGA